MPRLHNPQPSLPALPRQRGVFATVFSFIKYPFKKSLNLSREQQQVTHTNAFKPCQGEPGQISDGYEYISSLDIPATLPASTASAASADQAAVQARTSPVPPRPANRTMAELSNTPANDETEEVSLQMPGHLTSGTNATLTTPLDRTTLINNNVLGTAVQASKLETLEED